MAHLFGSKAVVQCLLCQSWKFLLHFGRASAPAPSDGPARGRGGSAAGPGRVRLSQPETQTLTQQAGVWGHAKRNTTSTQGNNETQL